jgi:zinc transporter ZupT
MGGLLAMLILEYVATFIGVNHLDKHHKTVLPTTHGSTAAAAPESPVLAHDASGDYNKLCKTSTPTTAAAAAPEHVTGKDSHGHVHSEAHAVDMIPSLAHSHGCRQQPACHTTAVKQQVTCITMELGCVFHSVVLGLALGVMKDAPQMVVTLLVVLSIHQAVEGLALGSVLVSAQRMSQPKRYVFAVVYALTLPVGIAAGLLASETYDPMSPVAVLVQGVANGLSGGMLLYVSLFSLLSAELSQHDLLHRPGLAGGLMVAALVGAAIMCVIGLWA